MILGAVGAMAQKNIKRLMAYSSIGHMGYALAGIASGTENGFKSTLVYISIYLVMNIGAFAVVFMMEGEGLEGNSINRFKGLAKRSPFIAAAMSLFMVSLAGFPPTAGFFGKLFLFYAAIKKGYNMIVTMADKMSIEKIEHPEVKTKIIFYR